MQDLHIHTSCSDGKQTPEEAVLTAIRLGLDTVGISDHSSTRFDRHYDMRPPYAENNYALYREEIARVKEKYRGVIRVLCGMEQDYYADCPATGFDYVIGSVHYLNIGNRYPEVDEPPPTLEEAAQQYFSGDIYSLAEAYFDTVGDVVRKTGCDIIGHFDLLSKYNEKHPMFDENNPRYVSAWQGAVDRLLREDAAFEVNFGAISKGYRTMPYPSPAILDYILRHGGKIVLSSDAHYPQHIRGHFDRFGEYYPDWANAVPENIF